jgi:hypothetical protein
MEKKARTRTLIQLGGILVKSGLVEYLGIPIGVDLQNHPDYTSKAFELLEILEEALKQKLAK